MEKIHGAWRQFVDTSHHTFNFKIGNLVASSLSGFIAGVIFTSIFWAVLFYLFVNVH